MTEVGGEEREVTSEPQPCKHGATPILEAETIVNLGDQFAEAQAGRLSVRYNCPTPYTCADAELLRRVRSEK